MSALPAPQCRYGYTGEQLQEVLGDRLPDFHHFMRDQTMALCDGRKFDYAAGDHRETGCGPHGGVVYSSDLHRFLAGRRPLD